MRRCTHPFIKILGISKRNPTSDDASLFCLSGDISRSQDDNFVRRSDLSANKLNFISDKKADVLYVLPLTPSA